jgi:hypothetical protein
MNATCKLFLVCALLASLFVAANGQVPATINVPGNTVVYNSASTSSQSYSSSYIDASVFYYPAESVDICHVINNILRAQYTGVGYPSTGSVIDARGILEGPNATTCAINPFDGVTDPFQTTILLPAATIRTQCPWVLPSNTRIVGQGRGNTGIALLSGFIPSSNNSVIEMGSNGGTETHCRPIGSYVCPSTGCTGISVEHLTISPEVGRVARPKPRHPS